jgi:hypothetical protein
LLGYFHARANLKKQPGIWVAGLMYQIFLIALLAAGGAFWITRRRRPR